MPYQLTINVWGEDRNNRDGWEAVNLVVFNRIDSDGFPDTVYEVVNGGLERGEACDFSWRCPEGKSPSLKVFIPRFGNEKWLAIHVTSMWHYFIHRMPRLNWFFNDPDDPTNGATFYITPNELAREIARKEWFGRQVSCGRFKETGRIGGHIFYFDKRKCST